MPFELTPTEAREVAESVNVELLSLAACPDGPGETIEDFQSWLDWNFERRFATPLATLSTLAELFARPLLFGSQESAEEAVRRSAMHRSLTSLADLLQRCSTGGELTNGEAAIFSFAGEILSRARGLLLPYMRHFPPPLASAVRAALLGSPAVDKELSLPELDQATAGLEELLQCGPEIFPAGPSPELGIILRGHQEFLASRRVLIFSSDPAVAAETARDLLGGNSLTRNEACYDFDDLSWQEQAQMLLTTLNRLKDPRVFGCFIDAIDRLLASSKFTAALRLLSDRTSTEP